MRLAAAYPRQDMPAETIVVYFDALSDLDSDLVSGAVRHLAKASKWFPAASEIRELCEASQVVRDTYAEFPDFTGYGELSKGEQLERLEAGLDASRGVSRRERKELEG